jgi:hypothetical protein
LTVNQEHATDGRSWPIAAYRKHQIKMIRLLLDCPSLIAYSQISDNLEREIETIEARYPVAIRDMTSSRMNVYSSCDEWQSFKNADGACDMFPGDCAPLRLVGAHLRIKSPSLLACGSWAGRYEIAASRR